ncbi:hypothetical protein [Azohydromonas caseinilytica]|uniref:Uncharacterized protein n=1 Tax=Azohydromonas caseinilytica TaxID=2728836 RepID=A0A848FJV2_9BURK|nr:hypothetical protein [Azohydromonas caseinilytica]NML18510.1 hypothetical protein [Azohydromonas caseinilytica]
MTTNTNYTHPLALIAAAPMQQSGSKGGSGHWFEAMARAWGQTLDAQAGRIQQQSEIVANGDDTPAAITELSTQSLKMSFLSNSSHTAISSVGQALDTLARKQ